MDKTRGTTMAVIKKLIKRIQFEIKAVYYDLVERELTDKDVQFIFWGVCILWTIASVYFVVTFDINGRMFDI
jgi:hypothetical protein